MKASFVLILMWLMCLPPQETSAQQTLPLYSNKNEYKIHKIKFPQTMEISYDGKIQQLFVTAASTSGLLTENNLISFSSMDYFRASRKKSGFIKVMGVVFILTGTLITATGISALSPDSFFHSTSGGVGFTILGGSMITGGVMMLISKRKYSPDVWQFRNSPNELNSTPLKQ